jgi:sugar phosphate isomerase/epimerase
MRLCFDATRFGCGLDGAVEIASQAGLNAVEYSFAPFSTTGKGAIKLDAKEQRHLEALKKRSANVQISCLNLDYLIEPQDKKSLKNAAGMLKKLMLVASAAGCANVTFSVLPTADDQWQSALHGLLNDCQEISRTSGVRLILRLSTALENRGKSLKYWRALEPQDWRDLISEVPNLGLSFSPADCLWLGIDYLKILSGVIKAVEHVEAHDVEINRELLADSGLYGPLWWRYRTPGKGQVDWPQFLELLKLYDYQGALSIHLDDEFIGVDSESLQTTLRSTIDFMSPLVKG